MHSKICLVNDGLKKSHIGKIVTKTGATQVILNAYVNFEEIIDSFAETEVEVINFLWNEGHSIDELRAKSSAFDISDKIEHVNHYRCLSRFLGVDIDDELVEKISRKAYTEKIANILSSLFMAKFFLNSENKTYLLLNSEDRWVFEKILAVIESGELNELALKQIVENIIPQYAGSGFSPYIRAYVYSCGFFFKSIFSFRSNKSASKKQFKLGIMVWNSALRPQAGGIVNEGIDWIVGAGVKKEDVLFYSEDELGFDYLKCLQECNYNYIDWSVKNAFRNYNLNDFIVLFRGLCVIAFVLPFVCQKIPSRLIVSLPYVLYNLYRWNKLLEEYDFQISLSYNDYSLSSLIKNYIFLKRNVRPWSYVHTCTTASSYDRRYDIKTPTQSYVSYDRRYYSTLHQKEIYQSSKIETNEIKVIGPLFSQFNGGSVFEDERYRESLHGKKVISIFTTSIGVKVKNSKRSHDDFMSGVISLLEKLKNKNVVFFFKGKGRNFNKNNMDQGSIHPTLVDLINSKRLLIISNELSVGQLIRSSDLVISMAFTSPTIEGLAVNVPSIYFDPGSRFSHNIYCNIKDFYFTSSDRLVLFCLKVFSENKEPVLEWVEATRDKIGLEQNMRGNKIICDDVFKVIYEVKSE